MSKATLQPGEGNLYLVKRERGQPAHVWIEETSSVNWQTGDRVPAMLITTDQKMNTGSGRQIDVENAVCAYCRERGYKLSGWRAEPDTGLWRAVATYSRDEHARHLAWSLKEQIEAHPRYVEAKAEAAGRVEHLNAIYGRHAQLLRQLVLVLENAWGDAIKAENDRLEELADEVLAEIGLPEVVAGSAHESTVLSGARHAFKRDDKPRVKHGALPDHETLHSALHAAMCYRDRLAEAQQHPGVVAIDREYEEASAELDRQGKRSQAYDILRRIRDRRDKLIRRLMFNR